MSLSLSPSINPYSFMHKKLFPSSSKGFRRSKIDGLHRLAFSNTAHSPWTIAFTRTESTHSNLLYVPPLFLACSISFNLASIPGIIWTKLLMISIFYSSVLTLVIKYNACFIWATTHISVVIVLYISISVISEFRSRAVYSKHPKS